MVLFVVLSKQVFDLLIGSAQFFPAKGDQFGGSFQLIRQIVDTQTVLLERVHDILQFPHGGFVSHLRKLSFIFVDGHPSTPTSNIQHPTSNIQRPTSQHLNISPSHLTPHLPIPKDRPNLITRFQFRWGFDELPVHGSQGKPTFQGAFDAQEPGHLFQLIQLSGFGLQAGTRAVG
jgi:hypothetical protein